MLCSISLWLDTLQRVRFRQIVTRAARRARFRWLYPRLGESLYPTPPPLGEAPRPAATLHESLADRSRSPVPPRRAAEDLAVHRFSFLGLPPLDLGTPVDWRAAPDGDPLWAYNLHYGEWALDLARAAARDGSFEEPLVELLSDWIDRNPVASTPGWEPYPLTRRIIAWSRLPFLLDGPAWTDFYRRMLEPSLRRQARFLAANLEHDVPNNHLLANYRALAWVGLLFDRWPESRRLRRIGLEGLWREMRRQVLPDGAHFERSISYHTIVLEDLLETRRLARERGVDVPPDVPDTLRAMLRFLAETRAPDGGWPMVNDSVPGYPRDPGELLLAGGDLREGAEPASHASFPDAGYAVLRDDRAGYLFFDAGPMGPGEVPGHGHADALSIVVHGGGRALIVDPGVATYAAGASRDACRSSAVHNTVTIGGEDPCVFWGPFRVARPPEARLLEATRNHVLGEHLGYRRLGIVHRRRVTWRKLAAGVTGWEIHDHFEGCGEQDFAFNLQLAPEARLDLDGLAGTASWPDGTVLDIRCLESPGGTVAETLAGGVSPSWNQLEEAPRHVLRWTSAVPCELRMLLRVTAAPSGRRRGEVVGAEAPMERGTGRGGSRGIRIGEAL